MNKLDSAAAKGLKEKHDNQGHESLKTRAAVFGLSVLAVVTGTAATVQKSVEFAGRAAGWAGAKFLTLGTSETSPKTTLDILDKELKCKLTAEQVSSFAKGIASTFSSIKKGAGDNVEKQYFHGNYTIAGQQRMNNTSKFEQEKKAEATSETSEPELSDEETQKKLEDLKKQFAEESLKYGQIFDELEQNKKDDNDIGRGIELLGELDQSFKKLERIKSEIEGLS